MITVRRRTAALVASALVLATVASASGPARPAAAAGPWLKPGVPHTYQTGDPSLTSFGPTTWLYSTNHGGADLPALWSGDATTWTARIEEQGAAGNQDGDRGYFNDAFPAVPWGIDNDSCDGGTPGV